MICSYQPIKTDRKKYLRRKSRFFGHFIPSHALNILMTLQSVADIKWKMREQYVKLKDYRGRSKRGSRQINRGMVSIYFFQFYSSCLVCGFTRNVYLFLAWWSNCEQSSRGQLCCSSTEIFYFHCCVPININSRSDWTFVTLMMNSNRNEMYFNRFYMDGMYRMISNE